MPGLCDRMPPREILDLLRDIEQYEASDDLVIPVPVKEWWDEQVALDKHRFEKTIDKNSLGFRDGQIVWVRDVCHPFYAKWGQVSYVRPITDHHLFRYLVEYINPQTKRPSGVCGMFPECKLELGPDDVMVGRRYA